MIPIQTISPQISLEINQKSWQKIEQDCARILAEVGLGFNSHIFQDRLHQQPQIKIARDRIFFDYDYALFILQTLQNQVTFPGNQRLNISAGGGALNIIDHFTSQIRPAKTEDLYFTLKACNSLKLHGDPPVIPKDIPMPLREVALYKLAWEHTRGFSGRDITTIETGEYIYEMSQVVGKSVDIPLFMISPLRVNEENLKIIEHFIDQLHRLIIRTMPMPGATAPLIAPGYLSQMLAEMVGGYLLLSNLFPEKKVDFGGKLVSFNLYTNTIGCGNPESLLYNQLEIQLLKRFGIQPVHFFWSMAANVDLQAASERMAGVLLSALAGVRHFGVAGRLQGEAFSLVQLLVDLEISNYVERVIQGQTWDDDDPIFLSEVEEAVSDGTYLGTTSTARHFKNEISRLDLFSQFTIQQRQEKKMLSLKERIIKRIENLEFTDEKMISADQCKEIEKIYEHAKHTLS